MLKLAYFPQFFPFELWFRVYIPAPVFVRWQILEGRDLLWIIPWITHEHGITLGKWHCRNALRCWSLRKSKKTFTIYLLLTFYFISKLFDRRWLCFGFMQLQLWETFMPPEGIAVSLLYHLHKSLLSLWLIHIDVCQKPMQYCNYPSIKNK